MQIVVQMQKVKTTNEKVEDLNIHKHDEQAANPSAPYGNHPLHDGCHLLRLATEQRQ